MKAIGPHTIRYLDDVVMPFFTVAILEICFL